MLTYTAHPRFLTTPASPLFNVLVTLNAAASCGILRLTAPDARILVCERKKPLGGEQNGGRF
jgi:hypothetical protein